MNQSPQSIQLNLTISMLFQLDLIIFKTEYLIPIMFILSIILLMHYFKLTNLKLEDQVFKFT